MTHFKSGLGMRMTMNAVAIPRDGMSLNEGREKWLEANPGNRVLDYGDTKGRELLVGHDDSVTAEYRLVPELSPPGTTLQQMAAEMRRQGFDVRDISHERQTVIVSEPINKEKVLRPH